MESRRLEACGVVSVKGGMEDKKGAVEEYLKLTCNLNTWWIRQLKNDDISDWFPNADWLKKCLSREVIRTNDHFLVWKP